MTREQVACKKAASDGYVYVVHCHGNRFLILSQGLFFFLSFYSPLKVSIEGEGCIPPCLGILYSFKFEVQLMDIYEHFNFFLRDGTIRDNKL